jgi:hypothetical protein
VPAETGLEAEVGEDNLDNVGTEPETEAITEPAQGPVVFEVTMQPSDCRETEGGWASFEVKALGKGLSYRWEFSMGVEEGWGALPLPDDVEARETRGLRLEGADEAELRAWAEGLPDGISFRCVVADASGSEIVTDSVEYAPEEG